MDQNSLFQMHFVITSKNVRQNFLSNVKFKIKISYLGQKNRILPNQMTEKYLVEVDIEKAYFYGCEKTVQKKQISIFERKFEKQKTCVSLFCKYLETHVYIFSNFLSKMEICFFWTVPIFVNKLTFFSLKSFFSKIFQIDIVKFYISWHMNVQTLRGKP